MPNPQAPESLSPEYFDHVYQANPDPWNFAASPYEAAKYTATLAALPRERYGRAFEAGCSIGVLTAQLGPRCGELLAIDVNEKALAAAQERCAGLPHVRFEQRWMPRDFPPGPFDLIVVSEVGYYLSMDDLRRFCRLTAEALSPGGHLVLVHWTPTVHDYPLTGDEVHETFFEETQETMRPLDGDRAEKYRLDVLERV